MDDITVVFLVVAATIGLFVWNRLPVIVVAMGSAMALHLTGLLTLHESLAGFGDPVIVFIAALFIVTAGLEATGVTTWAGRLVERLVAGSRTRLQVVGMLGVAALCPLINASGAVGALTPVIMLLVVRLGDSPARLLMPLAFSAGAGSHLALTGAPKNVLIADAVAETGADTLNFFEFALVGLPLLAGTVAIVVLFGERLLPRREAEHLPADLSRHAETLAAQYKLSTDAFRLRIDAGSTLAGQAVSALDLSAWPGLRLVTITGRDGAPRIGAPLAPGDAVVVRGTAEAAAGFAATHGLKLREVSDDAAAGKLINRMAGVAEAVIPPRSPFIGRKVFPGMVTGDGELIVMAIQRGGDDLTGEVALEVGDTVLLQGTWDAIDRRRGTPGVLLVDQPGEVKRQTVALGVGATSMLAIVAAMVVLIAGGFASPAVAALFAAGATLILGAVSVERAYHAVNWTTVILMAGMFPLSTALTATGAAQLIAGGFASPAVAALFAAGATLILGAVSVERAYHAVNWTTVILMAGMFPLSTALTATGAAQLIADGLVAVVGAGAPRLLLGGVFLLGVLLGVVISNTATCLILIPIAALSAEAFGVSATPVLMCLSVATSASFLTPVSTPVNTMVMGPAGYRFGDYWRLGLPLTLWYGVVAVWLVPLIWRF